MTTKCCETCRDDFAKEQGYSDERTAVCAWCKCHTSPVSEVIAEAVKEFKASLKCINSECDNNGSIPHQINEGEWEAQQCEYCYVIRFPSFELLTTTLNRVASVAREDEAEKAQVFGDTRYSEGRDAMKEKILAALNTSIEGIGMWQTSPQSYQGLSEAIKLITDLK